MTSIFRRRRPVSCFYCQEKVEPQPRNPRSFQCPECTCWNRYDARGEIISDEPAMYEEALNANPHNKYASAMKTRFPSVYSRSGFCHTCRTNQTLVVNLLSHYLPSPEDPDYETRAESLPAYKASLESRYPLICANCLPAVEEEIEKKNNFARTQALGGILKHSKLAQTKITQEAIHAESNVFVWKVRGVLWLMTLLTTISCYFVGAFDLRLYFPAYNLSPLLPFLVLLSIGWSFWDPTYTLGKVSGRSGRQIRVSGRSTYIKLQFLSWLLRMLSSIIVSLQGAPQLEILQRYLSAKFIVNWYRCCLCLEILIVIVSYHTIRIQQQPTLRLIAPHGHSSISPERERRHADETGIDDSYRRPTPALSTAASSVTSAIPDPDLFATLTLSHNPILTSPSNPIFGQTSLGTSDSSPSKEPPFNMNVYPMSNEDPDAMDWEPLNSQTSALRSFRANNRPAPEDSGTWLRPQRFFPPEESTGLESLLMQTRLVDEEGNIAQQDNTWQGRIQARLRRFWG